MADMKRIWAAMVFLLPCLLGLARAGDFRFYVFDETRTERLHYETSQDFSLREGQNGQPCVLSYKTAFHIRGIGQNEFHYQTVCGSSTVQAQEIEAFIQKASQLDTIAFRQPDPTARADGWVNLDGRTIHVSASVKSEIRRQWQAVLDGFLAAHLPAESRTTRSYDLQGDCVLAIPVTLAELLADPAKYDGKRIRLSGYYHFGLEDSSLAQSKDLLQVFDDKTGAHTHAIWLGEASSFADQDQIGELNDCPLTAEGTFQVGPSGPAGAWPGELNRVTLMKAP